MARATAEVAEPTAQAAIAAQAVPRQALQAAPAAQATAAVQVEPAAAPQEAQVAQAEAQAQATVAVVQAADADKTKKNVKNENSRKVVLVFFITFAQIFHAVKIINFAASNTIINQYVAELRDIKVQSDRGTFRYNLQRIGQLMAYEISKTLHYSEKTIQTPLDVAKANTPDDEIVLATVFRAGLPFHEGFLDIFDHAGNAFVSAYRYYLDEKHESVGIKVEYLAAPDLTDKTLIIADPMLATGGSLELAYQALCTKGIPKQLHLCCVIAAQDGIDNLMKLFKPLDNVTLWCAAIDPILNEHKYIVPGLGDAGDLAYGDKI